MVSPARILPSLPENTLSHCRALLDIISSIPVPALGPTLTIAAKLVAQIDDLQTLNDSCLLLAERAMEMVAAIFFEFQSKDMSPEAWRNIDAFYMKLDEVANFMTHLARMPWLKRFLRRFAIQKNVTRYTARLEDAFKMFQIHSAMHIQAVLHNQVRIQARIDRTTADIQHVVMDTAQVVKSLPTNVTKGISRTADDACHFQHGQVIATRSFIPKRFHHGTIDLGKLNENTDVIWKRYNRDQIAVEEFERERKVWKTLSHPSMVQFMGQSIPGSEFNFIVLTGVKDTHLGSVLQKKLVSEETCVSFLTALEVLQGIASALLYLGSQFQLGVQELDDCAKISNFLVDPSGRPILGRNLVEHAPDLGTPHHRQLDRLLKLFYFVAEEILFGREHVYPCTSWSAVGEKRRLAHLRPLLRLVAWKPSLDFRCMAERIDDLTDRLRNLAAYEAPSFCQIREELLATNGLYHAMSYCPEPAWTAELFDVGYVRGESFIFLCNARVTYGACIPVGRETEVVTLPDVTEDVEVFPGDILRYKFTDTNSASVQRRANNRKLVDTVMATRLLRDISPFILEEYGDSHQIYISDLIIITGIIDYPSGAGILFQDGLESYPNPFYFYCLPLKSHPWGYWSVHDTPTEATETIPGAVTNSTIQSQMIDFIQLQEEEGDNKLVSRSDSHLSIAKRC